MSYSVSFVGKPENVVSALEQQSEKLTGDSKSEYDAALPHLTALVSINNIPDGGLVKIDASGHAYTSDGKLTSSCSVKIEQIYGVLV